MEQPQKPVDRILQAMTPALAHELAHAVQAALQEQEDAFRGRLESAVREAEQAALNSAASRHEQALEEVRDEARRQAAAQLQTDSKDAVNHALAELTAQFEEERAKLQEEIQLWRACAQAQRELPESASQTDMLSRFLEFAGPFAPSSAIYVMRSDGLALWKSRGNSAFPDVVSRETTDPECYFNPVVVRGRTVAAVCARLPYKPETLDLLVASLSRAIEAFGMRLQAPAPRVPVT